MSLFDLSFVVATLATDDVVIKRFAAGTYDSAGRAVARSSMTINARGSVQPVTGQDIKRKPEGVESSDLRTLFVTAQINIADEISIGAARFQVAHVDLWSATANYTRAVCVLLNPREL